jgi:hypothetical protein
MVLFGPGYKLNRCEPVKARVWSCVVVICAPVFNDLTGVVVAGEQVLIQTFIEK